MRLADGPDEVHNRAIARMEFRKYTNARPADAPQDAPSPKERAPV